MPEIGWIYGESVPHGVDPFKWGLGKLFVASLAGDQGDQNVLWHFGQE